MCEQHAPGQPWPQDLELGWVTDGVVHLAGLGLDWELQINTF